MNLCCLGDPLFLTPLIKSGKLKEARAAALVNSGPVANLTKSYAGYLTVNSPQCGSNLFFWFFPAQVLMVSEVALVGK